MSQYGQASNQVNWVQLIFIFSVSIRTPVSYKRPVGIFLGKLLLNYYMCMLCVLWLLKTKLQYRTFFPVCLLFLPLRDSEIYPFILWLHKEQYRHDRAYFMALREILLSNSVQLNSASLEILVIDFFSSLSSQQQISRELI